MRGGSINRVEIALFFLIGMLTSSGICLIRSTVIDINSRALFRSLKCTISMPDGSSRHEYYDIYENEMYVSYDPPISSERFRFGNHLIPDSDMDEISAYQKNDIELNYMSKTNMTGLHIRIDFRVNDLFETHEDAYGKVEQIYAGTCALNQHIG